MKQLPAIFFLFLAFQGFCQMDPERENDTLKFIKVNGKVGLVNRNTGKSVLEPAYTDLKIEPWGIRFFDGELQGFLPKGFDRPIPANYKEITQVYSYFEARTENGTMDLYFGTELIASDLDAEVKLSEEDVLLEAGLIMVRKDEKSGIIDQKGTVVVPFEYSTVERVKSFPYALKNAAPADYILVLDKSPYFYSPEAGGYYSLGAPEYVLMKADGTLISDSVFTEVSEVNPDKNEMSLRLTKKLATLNSQFEITYSPYVDVQEFMEWKFGFTGTEQVIHNLFNQAVDTFVFVSVPVKLSWVYTEDGEMTSNYYTEPLFEDFVYVQKMTSGDDFELLTAIYDLKNEQVVSGWEKTITFVSKGIHPSGSIVWIYKNEVDRMAFGLSNGKRSDYDYLDIYHVGNQFYAFKKPEDTVYILCELVGDSAFVERGKLEKSFGSLNYIGADTRSVQEFDPEHANGYVDDFGNYYAYRGTEPENLHPAFRTPFTIFKNAHGTFGFISWNGKVRDLDADTLFQSPLSSSLLEYRSGNLWGAADIAWGSVFRADRPSPGFFYLLDGLALIYRLGEDEKHYVDHKGRTFYSVNTERGISKKGKFKGSEMYSDFEDTYDKKTAVIPYQYTEILQTWDGIHFLAKGTDKKWGIISSYADTLFPFQYDELRFGASKENSIPVEFPYRDYDEQCFTRIGGFHGILSLNLRKEIPAIYNRVNYVPDAAFIVEKNGKFGVYDYNLDEKIQPVLDEAFIASSGFGKYFLRARIGNKWYNMEFFEGKVPGQTTFLQAPAFDLVINETGFVKTPTGYEARDFNNVLLREEAVMSDYLDENQFLFKDGKIFLIDLKGKVLYPEGLTNIVILEDGRVVSVENGVTYSYATWKKRKENFTE
ncbi:hypothetical protein [Fluviicola sp.]|uniref:WG repeat-containing protein n=1 Tax=Fluviicola sp. TaxID=1917219 RepID=UPI0031DBC3A3